MNIFWIGSVAAAAFWQHGADTAILRDSVSDNARRQTSKPMLARDSIVRLTNYWKHNKHSDTQ